MLRLTPPNNNLGDKVINKFKGYNVDVDDILLGDGRLGTYFLEMGHGVRSTEVIEAGAKYIVSPGYSEERAKNFVAKINEIRSGR